MSSLIEKIKKRFEYISQAKLQATLTKTTAIASLSLHNLSAFYHFLV